MNRPAILRTIELTRELEIAGAELNMNSWGHEYECGTVGCLGGWMTLDPELRTLGLRNAGELKLPHDRGLAPTLIYEDGYYVTGYSALGELLGVSHAHANQIFGSWHPNSWPAARERLQDLLAENL